MANNLPHITLPTNEWVDLYDLSGITVGQPLVVENVGVCDIYLAVLATQPDKDHDAYNILKRDDDIRLANNLGDAGAWAFCNTEKGLISVAEREGFQPLLNSAAHDGYGNPISSLKGALDVHQADVHNIPANDFTHLHTTSTTLAAAANAGDVRITLADTTDFIDGTYVHFGPINETKEPIHPQQVGAPVGNVIQLDRPIDFSYLAGENITVSIANMVTASVGATIDDPVSVKYTPHSGQIEHIERLLFSMVHSTAASDDKFGGEDPLINGIVLRAVINGQAGTFTNWKNNSDIKLDMYDVDYTAKAGGGDFGTNGRGSFNRIGVVIKLDPATGDYIEFLLQDTLEIISMKVKFQGHIEGG